MLIDEDGVYLEVTSVEMKDDKLRYNVIVENDSGCEINIRFDEAYADSVEVDGVGIFGVEDGERIDDEFFFFQPLEGDGMEVLEGAQDLSFTIEVKDDDTRDTPFDRTRFPAHRRRLRAGFHAGLSHRRPANARVSHPTLSRKSSWFCPTAAMESGICRRQHAAHARDGGKYLPGAAVEAFEIYMYATNAWTNPFTAKIYVYYETTETLVEPFETAFSEYVTMPRADEISRVYAGIHRVRYDNGDIVEADPVLYSYWDIQ